MQWLWGGTILVFHWTIDFFSFLLKNRRFDSVQFSDRQINKSIIINIQYACNAIRHSGCSPASFDLTNAESEVPMLYIYYKITYNNGQNDFSCFSFFSPLGKLARGAIYFACVNFFFSLFFYYEQRYLSIYWTDFHDLFTKW